MRAFVLVALYEIPVFELRLEQMQICQLPFSSNEKPLQLPVNRWLAHLLQ